MESTEKDDQLVMPKYALYIWGILLSPVAAGVFLSLNILKVGKNDRGSIIGALGPLCLACCIFL